MPSVSKPSSADAAVANTLSIAGSCRLVSCLAYDGLSVAGSASYRSRKTVA
jgi:hypothetical protein